MKHQLLIVFAASLQSKDGDGVRLCLFLKNVPANKAPSANATLHFAGFGFKRFREPLVEADVTTHICEPIVVARFEQFKLKVNNADNLKRFKASRDPEQGGLTSVGVVASNAHAKVIDLIDYLKKQSFEVVIGSKADGGFNPYRSSRTE